MFNDVTVFNIREYLSSDEKFSEKNSYRKFSPSFYVLRIRMLKDF